MNFSIEEKTLHFKQPAGTSRGVYNTHKVWYITVFDMKTGRRGIGEAAPLHDLSCDYKSELQYTSLLRKACNVVVPHLDKILAFEDGLMDPGYLDLFIWAAISQDGFIRDFALEGTVLGTFPSILFGIETAILSYLSSPSSLKTSSVQSSSAQMDQERSSSKNQFQQRNFGFKLFDTPFSRGEVGIPINGLVWMGDYETMLERLQKKIDQGFKCVKLKIGAIDFEKEVELIKYIRESYPKDKIELRVDANGGFSAEEAMSKLEILSRYDIHSIEQPIQPRQWEQLGELCKNSPIPIALDEELIGINSLETKERMLDIVQPQYIIMKPTLHGGIAGVYEWYNDLCKKRGIGSWITSALESNIGLNAVANLAAKLYEGNSEAVNLTHGLGTGMLFTDNVDAPIEIRGDKLWTKS